MGKEDEKESIEIMKKMSQDFKVREQELSIKRFRVEDKRGELEKRGFDVNSIEVAHPHSEEVEEYSDSQSMYEMLTMIEKKLNNEEKHLNRLEKAYDEALSTFLDP